MTVYQGFILLAHKDSNLERQNQNLLCYQLHHGSILLESVANLKQKSNFVKFPCKFFQRLFNMDRIGSFGQAC